MTIKSLKLENFLCYYGNKSFEFSEGLNIILGHNGDGKSTIFTAFNWIFDPHYKLDLSTIYSKKKYSEIQIDDSFRVLINCDVIFYDEFYQIKKYFDVTKSSDGPHIDKIKEEIWVKNLTTGENIKDHRSISELSYQIFPEAFRNFSMFETETDALKIVEGKQLASLVRNFSSARYYEDLDRVLSGFHERADKQFRKEATQDQKLTDAINQIDSDIEIAKKTIDKLKKQIVEDETGREYYSNKINDLVNNLTISDDYKKIDEQINNINIDIENARNENKQRSKFNESIFDDFYLLYGFEHVMNLFVEKINKLRLEKNKIYNEESTKAAIEKLELENGATPFPPGFPSLDILNEILDDKICKICNNKLNKSSIDFISMSIKLFEESKLNKKSIKLPVIFPNNFIDEFEIISRTVQIKEEKYSKDRIVEEIQFKTLRILENNNIIKEKSQLLNTLIDQKNELLSKVKDLTEIELVNIRKNHFNYTNEKETLVERISKNNIILFQFENSLKELIEKRNRTLAQFTSKDFKQETVKILNYFSAIAKVVKEDEYNKFLNVLSLRATEYLKEINIGEITGKIELYKRGENEVLYRSLNDDDTLRAPLEDSGALQISKPLSILFAIADMAAEFAETESYPMIFDAPTSRFSPNREQEFFKVLKNSKKQRIVVTLRFLNSDENHIPYVNYDLFDKIEKDKAFFIKRVRPFLIDKDGKANAATICTEIEEIK